MFYFSQGEPHDFEEECQILEKEYICISPKHKNMKQYFLQIWQTPFIHGLYVAVSGAVIGAILSILDGFSTTGTLPNLKTAATIVGISTASALGGYLHKQGAKGGSGVINTTTPTTQP